MPTFLQHTSAFARCKPTFCISTKSTKWNLSNFLITIKMFPTACWIVVVSISILVMSYKCLHDAQGSYGLNSWIVHMSTRECDNNTCWCRDVLATSFWLVCTVSILHDIAKFKATHRNPYTWPTPMVILNTSIIPPFLHRGGSSFYHHLDGQMATEYDCRYLVYNLKSNDRVT